MPRKICLALVPFGPFFRLTSAVSAVDGGLFIIARLLFTQQLGNTHDIFRAPGCAFLKFCAFPR